MSRIPLIHSLLKRGVSGSQRLLFVTPAADSSQAHCYEVEKDTPPNDPPILNKDQGIGGVLCAGRSNARSGILSEDEGRVDLDFLAPPLSHVEGLHQGKRWKKTNATSKKTAYIRLTQILQIDKINPLDPRYIKLLPNYSGSGLIESCTIR